MEKKLSVKDIIEAMKEMEALELEKLAVLIAEVATS